MFYIFNNVFIQMKRVLEKLLDEGSVGKTVIKFARLNGPKTCYLFFFHTTRRVLERLVLN